ncbi:MAG: hypothetical protein ACQEVA_23620 [Myxococcota bacterium]
MLRFSTAVLACILMLCLGCETPEKAPGPPPTGTAEQAQTDKKDREEETETPAADQEEPEEFPVADDTTVGGEGSEASDTEPSAESDACPDAREPSGMCAQVITWAKNPDTGTCCEYPTPCHAPKDWKTFSSREACEE